MIARLPRPRLALAAVVAAACLVATAWRPEPAAAFPGQNGKIAFESSRDGGLPEIYVVNPDGSGQTRLTNSPDVDSEPAFSPDGRRSPSSAVATATPRST